MSEASQSAGAAAAPSSAPSSASSSGKKSHMEVDLNNSSRGVWLVKVPKYIADRWESAGDGAEVGRLKITKRQGAKPVVSFSLDDKIVAARTSNGDSNGGTNQKIPKEHKFVVGGVAAQTLAVLSHTAAADTENGATADTAQAPPSASSLLPDRLALEGKVIQRAECRPISNNTYMSIKKEALLKAIEPVRQTKKMEGVAVNFKPVANHAFNKAYEVQKKKEGKKSRDDRERVMEKLFALFEKHQYYNIRDLVKETRQPVTYLKEVLKDVCTYNLKNPHKNMWELKPEYRHYKREEDDDAKKAEQSGLSESDSD